ncbi:MAG: VWA domain-containing protein [Actinomycetota bacterium]|nr:VWA domain-containing protein [Actinomycetota bacterium]
MRFAQPLWLIALAAIPLLWVIQRRGISAVSRRQRTVASVVRSVIVAAIVLALAGLAVVLPERSLATIFVVDVSDSVGATGRSKSETFVREALAAKPPEALAGVVAFGGDARVEMTLQDEPELISIASRPDPSHSDVARALRLAAALMPDGGRRRIVLISDGRENAGDARLEAESLHARGLRVDSVAIEGTSGLDAAVVEIDAPSRVRVGESFDVEATLSSNAALEAQVTLRRGSKVVQRRALSLQPGQRRIRFGGRASRPGSLTYSLEVRSGEDSVPENDAAAALVLVGGKAKVAIVESSPGEGAALETALKARDLVVERVPMARFPGGEELAALDSIVLVDVPAGALTDAQVGALEGFVRDLGNGLVTVGGESSWSLGDYRGSELEALLPLNSDIKDPRRRPAIAQVLAIDTSGSMSACHCNPEGAGMREEGGVNKTDISRSAAARAVEALTQQDEVGILAFNTRSRFVVPLAQLPPDDVVREGLESLQPRGGTNIPQALRASVEALKASKASLKHIVMFTDGFTDQKSLVPAARWVRKQGITLSVLATGEGTGDELARMADAGGGRFYEGRNLHEIPELLMNEVVIATRRYVNEGIFYPKITGSSAATDPLRRTPPLLGYIGTSPKASASVLLAGGKYDDPLLATWRTGLGVASSWTSDAKSRWARRWVDWDGFADFWSSVVRETLPAAARPGFSAQATAGRAGIDITVEAEREIPEGTTATARVVGPDGSSDRIELGRSGLSAFSGTAPSGAAGTYLVSVALEDDGQELYRETVGAVQSYSPEYQPGPADQTFLREVASLGGGRYGIQPANAFDPGLPSGRRTVEVTSWLVLLAALLFPLDVALRRIIITRDEIAAVQAWRPSFWRDRAGDPFAPQQTHVGGLLTRKRATRVRPRAGAETVRAPGAADAAPPPEPAPAAEPAPSAAGSAPRAPSPPAAPAADDTSHVSGLLERKRRLRGD